MSRYENLLEKLEKGNKSSYYVAVIPYNPQIDAVLLGLRKEDGIWTSPAGGADEGESPEDCAVRECWEEAQLEVDKDKLISLGVKTAHDGKPVHCFTYVTSQTSFSVAGDPDQEVDRWDWFSADALPKALTRPKNQNRLETINDALMTLKGLKKSGKPAQIGESRTHADGSVWQKQTGGWVEVKKQNANKTKELEGNRKAKVSQITKLKGKLAEGPNYQSMLESMSDDKLNTLHSKLVETQPTESKNDKPATDKKTTSGKDLPYSIEEATAAGFTSDDHIEARNIHFDVTNKLSEIINKMRDGGSEVPQALLDQTRMHRQLSQAHSKAAAKIDKRGSKMKKSVTTMGRDSGVDINTADNAVQSDKSNSEWLERLFQGMQDFQYGDIPREFSLDKGTLLLTKVDDGVYSGFFKKIQEVEGGQLEDTANVRIERQTLSTLVTFLEAKEWILPAALQVKSDDSPMQDEQYQALTDKLQDIQGDDSPMTPIIEPAGLQLETPIDKKIKMLELMSKLLNS